MRLVMIIEMLILIILFLLSKTQDKIMCTCRQDKQKLSKIDADIKRHEEISKLTTGQGQNYLTRC